MGQAETGDAKLVTRGVASRRRQVLEAVLEAGSAQVDDLAARFRVSRMTVHRDLDDLADRGLVRKVHGGVTTGTSSLVETSILLRAHAFERQKRIIAREAALLVEPGQAIILDDSTTVAAMLPLLPAKAPLTVLTNSLGVTRTLCAVHGVKVICLGGDYVATFDAFFGLVCERAISILRANTLFMSSSSIFGLAAYHQEQDVVKTKRALMDIADRRILMVGSSKFGNSALNRMADLAEFDMILTDDGLDAATRGRLLDGGIHLRIASPGRQPGEPAGRPGNDAKEPRP